MRTVMLAMIVTTAQFFLEAYGEGARFAADRPSAPAAALLVSPSGFEVCRESARDNRYMALDATVDLERAHAQHRGLVAKLGELAVPVLLFPGREGLADGIYPNNAFATIPGRFIVGSMRHPARQEEARREDVRGLFTGVFGYALEDLSSSGCVAELTGPLVIDRPRGLGFCGLTGRADEAGCRAMHAAFDLKLTFGFDLRPKEYHTNIVLAVLAGRACVIHAPSFADPDVPVAIARAYPDRTLFLTDEEKECFAGNCIAVSERDVLMSATAVHVLRDSTRSFFSGLDFRLHAVPVDEFEKGGGSLRCLIAEIF